jgi:aminopeptidase-like protein
VVPDEWNIAEARLTDPNGSVVADFGWHNLHVVGYSEPVDLAITLADLQAHLFSLPEQPDAIPYVTSYYRRFWGFCLQHSVREQLTDGLYHAHIRSSLKPGLLRYGELLIPGDDPREVFLSTYVCHPSMANNELSGPVVTTWLAKWLLEKRRRFSYRIVFIPETIGSLVYLSRNLQHLKSHVIAGFNISCVGDERAYSFLPSRHGNTLSDRVARHVLRHHAPAFIPYSFLNRGSDERQYCAPGIDLPIASIMRSKYGEYPEYHTSKDDLSLVTPSGLHGGYEAIRRSLECLEHNKRWRCTVSGEPQLGRRGLYPTISQAGAHANVATMMNFLAYADGQHDLLEIADIIGVPVWSLSPVVEMLETHQLVEQVA